MDNKIDLLIVDDHKIFRDGLKLLLEHFPFVGKVAEASNGKEFLKVLEKFVPDIVIIDINMPVMGGIEATRKALASYPDLKIIVLTAFLDEDYVEQMLLLGVEGYLLKQSAPEEFEEALLKISSGGNYFSDEIVSTVARKVTELRTEAEQRTHLPDLTSREMEILELLCKGYNNDQIAEIIHVSPKTVEKHKSNLFQKTGTFNTVNLVIYAFKNELVDIHS